MTDRPRAVAGTTPADPRGIGVDVAVAVWRRRRWLAIPVFVLSAAATAAAILSLPPLYGAAATVLVERQQISEAVVRPSVTTELETRIQTIHKQVTSRARLSDVITRFNLYPEMRRHAPLEAVVERMRRDIAFDLSGVPQQSGRTATIAFTLSYVGSDPYVVAEVANTLVGSYVEENTRTRERQAVRTAEFLKAQLDDAKRELETHEQREREFTLRHATELPQQVDVNLAALDRLNTQLRLNGEYQLRAIERRERIDHELADATAKPRDTPAPLQDPSNAELIKLQQQLAALSAKYSAQYPEVIRLKAAIAALERQRPAVDVDGDGHGPEAPAADAKTGEQRLAQIDAELGGLKKEELLLRGLIAGYETRVENAPKRHDELQQLTRDYAGSKERYETIQKRYDEAKVAETLEQGQDVEGFRVLDPAVPPTAPTAPNRFRLLLLAVAGSLALAFVAMVAAEKLDATFHSVDELRAFAAVPTVAVIRRISTPSASRRARLRVGLAGIGILVAIGLAIGAGRYVGTGNERLVRMTDRGRG
jgi:polysaccharide chain length determinant protein (PEP-CTERM system associated)